MKRIVCGFLLAAVLLFGFCFAGCKGDVSGEVRFWTYDRPDGEKQEYLRLIDDFTGKTGVQVTVSFVPRDKYSERLKAAADRGEAPDICILPYAEIPDAAASGMLSALGDRLRISDIKPDKSLESARRACAYQAKTYGVPLTVSGDILLYNKNLVPDSKVPATQDALIESGMTTAVKDKGEAFVSLLYAGGGSLINKSGSKPAFDSEEGQKAALALQKTGGEAKPEDFSDGKAEFLIAGEREWNQISESVKDFALGAAVLPGAGKGHLLGGDAVVMLNSAKKKQNAFLVIEYLGQEEQLKRASAIDGTVNVLKKQSGDNPAAVALLRQAEEAEVMPPVEGIGKIRSECIGPMAEEVAMGADIPSALTASSQRAAEILSGNTRQGDNKVLRIGEDKFEQ